MMKTKTIKKPSVGLTLILSISDKCYNSVVKSTLLCQRHITCHDHYRGLIPQKKKQEKPFSSVYRRLNSVRSLFFRFLLAEKESLKGITVFGVRLWVLAHKQTYNKWR